MIHMLLEPDYMYNSRMIALLDGVKTMAAKKKTSVNLVTDFSDVDPKCRVIILAGASLKWVQDAVAKLDGTDVHVLLFGFRFIKSARPYSSVTQPYSDTMYLLTRELLKKEGNARTAFVGYNRDSLPDALKFNGFRHAVTEAAVEYDVYVNEGDITACIRRFTDSAERYVNVVCANDSIAFLLTNELDRPEAYNICGFGGMLLSKYIRPPIYTARVDYYEAGITLVELYAYLTKCDKIRGTSVTLDMEICRGANKTDAAFAHIPDSVIMSEREVDFFGDTSISELERIENMLLRSDDVDESIMRDVGCGLTYEEIAEKHYFAVNTVKYRLHKMCASAQVQSRKELIGLLDKYKIQL